MLTIIQHPLEAGILIALVTYSLILAWSLLARLKWLPGAVVRPVHHVLAGLVQLPLLGCAVSSTRRHPLSLGLVAAILVGALVPALAVSLTLLLIGLAVMVVMMVVGYVIVKGEGAGADSGMSGYSNHALFDETELFGHPSDPMSYDQDWMAGQGKLAR